MYFIDFCIKMGLHKNYIAVKSFAVGRMARYFPHNVFRHAKHQHGGDGSPTHTVGSQQVESDSSCLRPWRARSQTSSDSKCVHHCGMIMPGRKDLAGNSYRYEFDGKETDKDIGPCTQDYGMRFYDARLGKF